jgi:tetratricopeptide (TPR) repeat protein
VQVKLVEVRPEERNVWGQAYERPVRDVLTMSGDVARAIAREVRVRLTPDEAARLASQRPVDPATYEAYLKGMYYINKPGRENIPRGIALLHEAVDRNPGDAFAYAGLAHGYATLGHGPAALPDVWPRARAAALRAVTLDSTLADAHAAVAEAKLYYEWDWPGAERSFRRALELNPNLAIAHYHYAWYLALVGRMDEAIAEHRRAAELDPFAPGFTAWLGALYQHEGRHDDAIEVATKALELGMTYVRAGREPDARRILAELESSPSTPWRAYALVKLYTALGEIDKAFEALASGPPHGFVPWLSTDPDVARLRRDHRFEDFLRRLNLPRQ